MATTSTNKQPLLVDRVFHEIVPTKEATNLGIDVVGTNSAALLLNCLGTDGAIVEYLYALSRDDAAAYDVNVFLSSNNDYMRPTEAFFIGTLTSSDTIGARTELELPITLTPVPQVGTDPRNRGLYVPSGKALWVARNSDEDVATAPLIGAQGGYF